MKCEIKWMDKQGDATPDTNDAICLVHLPERVIQMHGRGIRLAASPWWPCCAEHAKRLQEPGMEQWQRKELISE